MTMKHLLGVVACAAIGLAATVLTTSNASPGPGSRAALEDVSRRPFQQYVYQPCPIVFPCILNFAPVPPRSRLDVSNVSCLIQFGSDLTVMKFAQLLVRNEADGIVSASTLVPIAIGSVSPSRNSWAANHAVSVFASARQHFQILLEVGGPLTANDFMGCHVSGQMVKLG